MSRKAAGRHLIRERSHSLGQHYRRAAQCVQVTDALVQPVEVTFEPLPGGGDGVGRLLPERAAHN